MFQAADNGSVFVQRVRHGRKKTNAKKSKVSDESESESDDVESNVSTAVSNSDVKTAESMQS